MNSQSMEQAGADPNLIIGPVQVGLHENSRGERTQEAARVAIEADDQTKRTFAIALGSITEADAPAIGIPGTAQFGPIHGRVTMIVANTMDSLAGVEPSYDDLGHGPGANFFREAERQTRERLEQTGDAAVPLGAAAVFPSGQLAGRQIEYVTLVNLEEDEGHVLTPATVSLAVRNACQAVETAGATSLAVIEFGTGFHYDVFSSRAAAWAAILSGYMQYIEAATRGETRGTVTKLTVVTPAGPNEQNAQAVGKLLDDAIDTLPQRS